MLIIDFILKLSFWLILHLKSVKNDHFTSIEQMKKFVKSHEKITLVLQTVIDIQSTQLKESLK